MFKKNILTLDNIDNFELISKKDENGREIKLYTFDNVYFTGNSEYYPDILFNISNKNDLILPIKEKTMSLNKKSYYEENGLTYIEKNKNNSLNQINDQIYEITKLIFSKITNFKISNLDIKNAITNVERKIH